MHKKDWSAIERNLIELIRWLETLRRLHAYNDPDMVEQEHQARFTGLDFELREFLEYLDEVRYIYDRQVLED